MSPRRVHRLLALCAAATVFALPKTAHAVQRFWGNSAGGSFNTPANWQLGVVPGPSDSAYFSLGAFSYTVNFPTDVSNTQLTIDPNNVTFDLLAHQYQLTSVGNDLATAAIRVGAQVGDNAFLRLIDGSVSGSGAVVGWVSGSEDTLVVSTSATLNTNILDVGHFGTGHLNVDSGGILNSAYATLGSAGALSAATIALDGATSRWTNSITLTAGGSGKGIITIDNGASATIGNDAFIAAGAGSTGSLTVDGTSATAPSSFTVANDLDVADSGTAFVSITNQAFVSARNAVVGRNFGSKGTIKITDNFAEFRCNNLYIGGDSVGPGGTGIVNIANNGVLTVSGPITVWPGGTLQSYPVLLSTSELRLRGGKLSAWSNFNAPINSSGGTIEVPGSNILFLNNSLTTNANSLLQRIGTGDLWISGPQTHSPSSTFQARGGQTFLATSAGTPATSATPATANLNVTVGPETAKIVQMTPTQLFHSLTVSASSAGRQSFDLNSNTAPGAFNSLSIYTPASKADLWAAISNANRAGAPDPQDGIYDSHLASHPNSRIGLAALTDAHGDPYIQIRPTRIGDINLDGTVTINDFIELSSHLGASGPGITWQEGDLNYDGAITVADFLDLSANFGSSYSTAASPTPVPEPATLLLLAPILLLSRRPHKPTLSATPTPEGF